MSFSSIVFQQIRVNEAGSNSGVFVGNNTASLWGSFSKQQTAFELGNGGRAIRNRTWFSDNDVVDVVAVGTNAVVQKRVTKSQRPPRRTEAGRGGRIRKQLPRTAPGKVSQARAERIQSTFAEPSTYKAKRVRHTFAGASSRQAIRHRPARA